MVNGISSTNSLNHWLQMRQMSSNKTSLSADDIFAKIDTDGNGSLSQSEWQSGKPGNQSSFANQVLSSQADSTSTLVSQLQGMEQFLNSGGNASGTGGLPPADDTFSKIDINGDGLISKEELANDMAAKGIASDSSADDSQTDLTSVLLNLLQGNDEKSKTSGSKSSESGSNNIVSLLSQTISKYMQFTEGSQGLIGLAKLAAMV